MASADEEPLHDLAAVASRLPRVEIGFSDIISRPLLLNRSQLRSYQHRTVHGNFDSERCNSVPVWAETLALSPTHHHESINIPRYVALSTLPEARVALLQSVWLARTLELTATAICGSILFPLYYFILQGSIWFVWVTLISTSPEATKRGEGAWKSLFSVLRNNTPYMVVVEVNTPTSALENLNVWMIRR